MASNREGRFDEEEYEAQLRDLAALSMGDIAPYQQEREASDSALANNINFKQQPKEQRLELNPGKLGQRELSIPVPWGTIEAKTWGNSTSGKPTLAVHGWMDNAGTFDRLIPLLPQALYIVAIDVPGHGRSSHLPPGVGYHYIDFVTMARRVVEWLGWDKKGGLGFWWLGHSMGASIGMLYASIFPGSIERLMTLDQVMPLVDQPEDLVDRLRNGISTFLVMDAQEAKETKSPPMYTQAEALDRLLKFTKYSEYPLTEAAARTLLVRGTTTAAPGKVSYTRDHRLNTSNFVKYTPEALLGILRNLKCHTLMIRAKETPPYLQTNVVYQETRKKAIAIYNANCASYKMVEVAGNHFVHLNQPEVVAPHICEWLQPHLQ